MSFTVHRHALNEIIAPPEVDTMREEICPVCGSEDSYVGDKCTVCGFDKPPSLFMDPDTSLAQNVNLRQDQQEDANDDGAGELACPVCGETFPSAEALNEAGDPHFAPAANSEPALDDLQVPEIPEGAEQPQDEEVPKGQAPDIADADPEGAPVDEQDEEANPMGSPPPRQDESAPGQEVQEPADEEQEGGPQGPNDEIGEEVPEEEPVDDSELVDAGQQENAQQMAEEEAEAQYGADREMEAKTGYEVGDICPNCGQGLLQPASETDLATTSDPAAKPSFGAPPGQEVDESDEGVEAGPPQQESDDQPVDDEEADDEDGETESEEDDDKPDFLKKKPKQSSFEVATEGESTMAPRPPQRQPQHQGRVTPKQGSQPPAQPPNPAQQQRTALHESLTRQANVLRAQDQTIRQLSAACHQERTLRFAAEARVDTLERQMLRLAQLVGADADAELRAINEQGFQAHSSLMKRAASIKVADQRDPAQPVPEPGAQPPVVTEQEAAQPAARTDVTQLGATPVTDVSADASIALDQPYGTTAFQPLDLNEVDVTAPVANTQGHLPPEQTIVPVEVRVGDPDDPTAAFGWTLDGQGSPAGQTGGSVGSGAPTQRASGSPPGVMPGTRAVKNTGQISVSALRLARLRIQARIASGDDLQIAASIEENPAMTEEAMNAEIRTLSQVLNAQPQPQARVAANRGLVPRSANPTPPPSLAPSGEGPIRAHASTGTVGDDEFAFE